MDREVVLALLALLLGGASTWCVAWWPATRRLAPGLSEESGWVVERQAWLRLWTPVLPGMVIVAALIGWALQEPDDAEPVRAPLVLGVVPFAAVVLRALGRSLRSLAKGSSAVPAATVGLLRPRVVLSLRLRALLDDWSLRAVLEHERAHARHRDPLRIWFAQIATDLQWPWPAAKHRFEAWLQALEWARDDEARRLGVEGEDLAAAVLAAARLASDHAPSQAAAHAAGADSEALRARIARLLAPLFPGPRPARGALALLTGTLLGAAAAGAAYGEAVLPLLVLQALH